LNHHCCITIAIQAVQRICWTLYVAHERPLRDGGEAERICPGREGGPLREARKRKGGLWPGLR
jgi:hypothetical protein